MTFPSERVAHALAWRLLPRGCLHQLPAPQSSPALCVMAEALGWFTRGPLAVAMAMGTTLAVNASQPNADRLASRRCSSRMFQRRKNVNRWWNKVFQLEAWA